MNGTCSIDGCGRPVRVKSRGWCNMHDKRWKRTGDPLSSPRLYGASAAEKLTTFTTPQPNGCQEWSGPRDVYGYGRISVHGESQFAHRVAWQEANGPIPAGMLICHTCDNPPCCAPEHLFPGTDGDNAADKVSKGRQRRTGTGVGKLCTISWEIADQIRAEVDNGASNVAVARAYGVSPSIVSDIKRRRTWDPDRRLP